MAKKIIALFILLVLVVTAQANAMDRAAYAGRTTVVVMVPGLFNEGHSYFIPLLNKIHFLISKGYKIIPWTITLPYRNIPFEEQMDQKIARELGERTIEQDAEYVEQEILSIIQTIKEPINLVIIGHSRGALIAMMIAYKNPEIIQKACFLNPAMPSGIESKSLSSVLAFLETLRSFDIDISYDAGSGLSLKGKNFMPAKRSRIATDYTVFHPDMPKPLKDAAYKKLRLESSRTIYQLAFEQPVIGSLDPGIEILIIGGKKDRLIPVKAVNELAKKLNTKAKFFDTAHYSFWGDEGEKVMAEIMNFVKK